MRSPATMVSTEDAVALVNLVTGARSTSAPRTELIVIVPLATLDSTDPNGGAAEYSDGTPMPVAIARRHACDANIIPVVLGGDGMPLEVAPNVSPHPPSGLRCERCTAPAPSMVVIVTSIGATSIISTNGNITDQPTSTT